MVLHVRSGDTAASLARVLAHELGHVVDIELNDPGDRARWREERGISATVPWWPEGSSLDFDTGAGDFAEAFAVWEIGASSQSRVAGSLDAGDLALIAELAQG